MKVKATAAEWAERVRAWRESGQSAPEFAEGKGYSETLLRWWGSELARRERPKPRVGLARVVRAAPASVPLTDVVEDDRVVGVERRELFLEAQIPFGSFRQCRHPRCSLMWQSAFVAYCLPSQKPRQGRTCEPRRRGDGSRPGPDPKWAGRSLPLRQRQEVQEVLSRRRAEQGRVMARTPLLVSAYPAPRPSSSSYINSNASRPVK